MITENPLDEKDLKILQVLSRKKTEGLSFEDLVSFAGFARATIWKKLNRNLIPRGLVIQDPANKNYKLAKSAEAVFLNDLYNFVLRAKFIPLPELNSGFLIHEKDDIEKALGFEQFQNDLANDMTDLWKKIHSRWKQYRLQLLEQMSVAKRAVFDEYEGALCQYLFLYMKPIYERESHEKMSESEEAGIHRRFSPRIFHSKRRTN